MADDKFKKNGIYGVIWDFERRGYCSTIQEELRRVIGAFGRQGRWANIKVGLTNDPDVRWRCYRDAGWHALAPIYRTSSLSFARRVETELIDYAVDSKASFYLWNQRSGGAGMPGLGQTYFVYLALARAYARIRG